jgi:succinyl-diaminopimelate desuccinylase
MYNEAEVVRLLKDLISFRTTRDSAAELVKCVNYIEDYFSGLNLDIKLYEKNNVLSIVITKHSKTPKIFLAGHFDVVEGDDEQFKPVDDGRKIYGRGALDMKSGLAILMYIMKELAKTNDGIGLMITGDEEVGGMDGTKYLLEQGYRSEVVLLPDGGLNPQTIIVKEKGFLRIKLSSLGMPAHSSRPWLGKNAFDSLLGAIENIKKIFIPLSEHPEGNWVHTLNIGKISGGVTFNQVAAEAFAELDIRYTEEDTLAELYKKIVLASGEEVGVELVLSGVMTFLDTTLPLVKNYILSLKDIGLNAVFSSTHGSSDARYFAEYNIPVIMSQPEGGLHHARGEWVSIASLETYYDLILNYLKKVSSNP